MKDEELDMLIANVEYEPQQIKDYIINLQEENKKLNNKIHDITETLNETYNNRTELRNENKRLKEKINLAENILYDYLYKDGKITEELYLKYKGE